MKKRYAAMSYDCMKDCPRNKETDMYTFNPDECAVCDSYKISCIALLADRAVIESIVYDYVLEYQACVRIFTVDVETNSNSSPLTISFHNMELLKPC